MPRKPAIEALEALTSPLRLEIVDWFQAEEELSIRDLADRLERKASSITYHVRRLEDAGVLVQVGQRQSGKRSEVVYALAGSDVRIGGKGEGALVRKHRIQVLKTLLRQAEREYERAALREIEPRLRRESLYASRQRARLTAAERRAVWRHVEAVRTIFQEARAKRRGTSYAWSVVMTPLETE